MANILELLKNEEVEWKKLGEIADIQRGRVISKKYLEDHKGKYPVYSSQTKDEGVIGKIDTYDFDGEYITWTTDGAYAGTVFYRKGKFSITNICGLITPKDQLIIKYLYYWLQGKAKRYVRDGSGNPKLMSNVVAEIEIPIPSLETQEKIVEILDKFTNYVNELQTELQSRNKQYTYYRDLLLSKEYLNKVTKEIEEDKGEWVKLEELTEVKLSYGSGAKAVNYDGKVRYIRITDINENGLLKNEKVSPEVIEDKYILKKGDILFARSGATVGKNYLHDSDEPSIYAGYLIKFSPDFKKVNSKYVYHCVNNSEYDKFILSSKSTASQPNINAQQYSNFKILVPPLHVQQHIVSILDKFDTLVHDIKEGLPKEIELRQKQYEYWREQLLSFNR